MTQIDPNPPYTEQKPEYREEIHVMGGQLGPTVERLLHEGTVRRIIIKHEGHPVLEIPLTIGVVGVLVAPLLAAVGAIGAAVTNCTIEVIRTGPLEQTSDHSLQRIGQTSFTVFSGQSYSISHSGMRLFQQGSINILMSEMMIDLVSAPIEPGEYRLELTVTMGSVEIFLPHSVQFTLEGSAIAGGRNVHEGPRMWGTMKQKLRYLVSLPDQSPDFAFASFNPERPVRIHFVTHITMGSIDIYRL